VKTVYIYTLSDPRSGDVRYIGRAIAPQSRLKAHVNARYYNDKVKWINELKTDGLLPVMTIIDSVDDKVLAREKEQYWMNKYTMDGCELLNSTGAFMSNFMVNIPLPQFYKMRDLSNAHQMNLSELVCHLIDNAELPAKEQAA